MALCPSNQLAEGLKGFPTLGDGPFTDKLKMVATSELYTAGIPRGSVVLMSREVQVYKEGSDARRLARAGVHIPNMAKPEDREWIWLHEVRGEHVGWEFTRAWYYWVAKAKGYDVAIPKEAAEALNAELGDEVRVDGYGGGREVTDDVESYHVDTPRGLAELLRVLKENDELRTAERDARYEKKYGK